MQWSCSVLRVKTLLSNKIFCLFGEFDSVTHTIESRIEIVERNIDDLVDVLLFQTIEYDYVINSIQEFWAECTLESILDHCAGILTGSFLILVAVTGSSSGPGTAMSNSCPSDFASMAKSVTLGEYEFKL